MEYPEKLDCSNARECVIRVNYNEFYKYLLETLPKELTFGERLYWFYNNITEKPVCKNCGAPVKFKGATKGYAEFCSIKCSNSSNIKKDKIKATNNEKFGGNAPACSKDVQAKMKATNLERHGSETYNNRESAHKTLLEKFGGIGNASDILKEKHKQTCIERYGVDNGMKAECIKNKMRENNFAKYGCYSTMELDYVKNKIIKTKQKNKTFNTSAIEEEFAEYLDKNHIKYKRQYKSKEYPYACDFYFPDKNVYLEIQAMWTHGEHPFDPNSKEDQATLQEWINKNTGFYNNAINAWTKRDVEKRNTAKVNNLNYLEIFTNDINILIYEYERAIKRF